MLSNLLQNQLLLFNTAENVTRPVISHIQQLQFVI